MVDFSTMEDISSDDDFEILADNTVNPDTAITLLSEAVNSFQRPISDENAPLASCEESDGGSASVASLLVSGHSKQAKTSRKCRTSHHEKFPPPIEYMVWKLTPIDIENQASHCYAALINSLSENSDPRHNSSEQEHIQPAVLDVTSSECDITVCSSTEILTEKTAHDSSDLEIISDGDDNDVIVLHDSDQQSNEILNVTPEIEIKSSTSCDSVEKTNDTSADDRELISQSDILKEDNSKKMNATAVSTFEQNANVQSSGNVPRKVTDLPAEDLNDLANWFKMNTNVIQQIANQKGLVSSGSEKVECKTETKYFYDATPFYQKVGGLPMGKPVARVSPPPVIELTDDEERVINKPAPLAIMKCHQNVYRPFTVPELIIPSVLNQPNVYKEEISVKTQLHSSDYLKTPVKHFAPKSNPAYYEEAQEQNVQGSNSDSYSQILPANQCFEDFTRKPIIYNFNEGEILKCGFCTFKAQNNNTQLVVHYVNDHPNEDPPCGLNSALLALILEEKEQTDDSKTKTGIRWLDDLTWIPNQRAFQKSMICKMPNCHESFIVRATLINHLQTHREEILNDPKSPVHPVHNCRMCKASLSEPESFYEHCTSHTGEYQHGCGHCKIRMPTKTQLIAHNVLNHDSRPNRYKYTSPAININPTTIVYGYICCFCGFVQINRTRVERHVANCHHNERPHNREIGAIHKFDLARPEPKPFQRPPSPPPVPPSLTMQQHPTAAGKQSEVNTRNDTPSSNTTEVSKRKKSAPVKIRGDPRTAISRQDKLTQNIPNTSGANLRESGDSNQPEETVSSNEATELSQPQGINQSQSPEFIQTRNAEFNQPHGSTQSRGTTLHNHTPEIAKSHDSLAVTETGGVFNNNSEFSETVGSCGIASLDNTVSISNAIATSVECRQVDESHLTRSDDNALEDKEPQTCDTDECTVEFEAVTFKSEDNEIDNSLNVDNNLVEDTTKSNMLTVQPSEVTASITPTQAPSIFDTISRLRANLGPSTSDLIVQADQVAENSFMLPSSTSVVEPVEETPVISIRKQKDWHDRRRTIVCNCLTIWHSSQAFDSHRNVDHRGEKRISCFECLQKFNSSKDYVDHLWSTCPKLAERIYVCKAIQLCRFITSDKDKFESHVNLEHPAVAWLPCYWCKSKFDSAIALAHHIGLCDKKCLINVLNKSMLGNSLQSGCAAVDQQPSTPSPEEPLLPHLKVVYLCSVKGCSHQSLEREVFIDHMQVDHAEKKDHICKYCCLQVGNIYDLVMHTEDKHREGIAAVVSSNELPTVSVSTAPVQIQNHNCAVAESSSRSPLALPPTENAVAVSQLLDPNVHRFTAYLASNPEWQLEEDRRVYQLAPFEEMCQIVCLSFFVTSNQTYSEHLEAKLHHWRTKISNYNPRPEVPDPLEFIKTIKTPDAMKSILNERKLRHIYKCFGRECVFTSNVENEFREHLAQTNCKNNQRLHCVYCGEEHKTIRGLTTHVTKKHGLSIYQCPDCIYRTRNVGYLLLHVFKCHTERGTRAEVLRCLPPVSEEKPDKEDEAPELFSVIHPVSCIGDCPFVCLDVATFLIHHATSHSQSPHVVCYLCSRKVERDNLEVHLKLHNVHLFHCEYCGFGDDLLPNVILHVCQVHPHLTGRVLIRKKKTVPSVPPVKRVSVPTLCANDATTLTVGNSQTSRTTPSSIPSTVSTLPTSDPVTPATVSGMLKCGFQLCKFSTANVDELGAHLKNCPYNQPNSRLYCHLCFTPWLTAENFLEHVGATHDESQVVYLCGVCDYRAHLTSYIKTHLELSHNLQFNQTKCEVKPREKGSKVTEWVYNLLPVRMVISKSFTGSLQSSIANNPFGSSTNKNSTDMPNKGVSASDLDIIPNKEIFDHEIKCADCDSVFKVRKNLIKHLEQHVKDRESPTKRAGSSPARSLSGSPRQSSSRRSSADPTQQLWYPDHFPDYVPLQKRYSCCTSGCTYIAPNSASLETHISVVHDNPLDLPCPHCPEVFEDMSNLHRHIELHGPQLFGCFHCSYLNNHENIVNGHCMAAHRGLPPRFKVIRNEIEAALYNSNFENLEDEEGGELKCEFCCNFRCHSESVLRKHLIQCLSLEKYMCNLCARNYSNEKDIEEHFSKSHNGCTLDISVVMNQTSEEYLRKHIESELARKRDSVLAIGQSNLQKETPRVSSVSTEVTRLITLLTSQQPEKSQSSKSPSSLFTSNSGTSETAGVQIPQQSKRLKQPLHSSKPQSPSLTSNQGTSETASAQISQQSNRPKPPSRSSVESNFVNRDTGENIGASTSQAPTLHRKRSKTSSLQDDSNRMDTDDGEPSTSQQSKRPRTSSHSYSSTEKVKTVNHDKVDVDADFRYHCTCCPFSTKTEDKWKSHLRNNHLKTNHGFKCCQCDQVFGERHEALQHQKNDHVDLSSNEIVEVIDDKTEVFIDWVLKRLKKTKVGENGAFPRPLSLVCHKDGCQEVFTNLYLFRTHFITHLYSSGEIPRSASQSHSHGKLAHVVTSISIADAQSAAKLLKQKKQSATSTTQHQAMCPYCDYMNLRKTVKEHIFRHYGYVFFKCPYCPHEGVQRLEVRSHVAGEHPLLSLQVSQKEKPPNLIIQPVRGSKKIFELITSPDPTVDLNNDNNGYYSCSVCNLRASSERNIRYHCQNNHDLASMILLGNHARRAYSDRYPAIIDAPTTSENVSEKVITKDSITCKECGEILPGLTEWAVHFHAKHEHVDRTKKKKFYKSKKNRRIDSDTEEETANRTSDTNNKEARCKTNEKYSTALKCNHCGFASANLKGIQDHWKRTHRNKPFAYKAVKDMKTYKCSSCAYKTPNCKEGKSHIKDQHCASYTCRRCEKSFFTLAAVKIHNGKLHGVGAELLYTEKPADTQMYNQLLKAMLESYGKDNAAVSEAHETPSNASELIETAVSIASETSSVIEQTAAVPSCSNNYNKDNGSSFAIDYQNNITDHETNKIHKKHNSEALKWTRKRTGPLWDMPEFTYYKRKPRRVDWSCLKVNTNFKGFRNATISGKHLREIFNMDPIVLVKDIRKEFPALYSKSSIRF